MSGEEPPYRAPPGYAWDNKEGSTGLGGSGPSRPVWVLYENPEPGYEFVEEDIDLAEGRGTQPKIVKRRVYRMKMPKGGRSRKQRKGKKTQRRRR
jgi:hypothetical protein